MNEKKLMIVLLILGIAAGVLFAAYNLNSSDSGGVGIDTSITSEDDKSSLVDIGDWKVLVVYFSETGNTQALAKLISDQVGGDFRRIETVNPYPEGQELFDYAKNERDNDERPEIKDLGVNPEEYDVIFVGYPIWWYTLPMPMYSFFDMYDFSGKTIIPFNTHRGSGNGGTYETIREFEPDADVLEGLPIAGEEMDKNQTDTVVNWLENLGYQQK